MQRSKILIFTGSLILIFMSLIYLISNNIPDFLIGLLFGAGIALVFLGIYSRNNDLQNIKRFKKNLVHKFLKR